MVAVPVDGEAEVLDSKRLCNRYRDREGTGGDGVLRDELVWKSFFRGGEPGEVSQWRNYPRVVA